MNSAERLKTEKENQQFWGLAAAVIRFAVQMDFRRGRSIPVCVANYEGSCRQAYLPTWCPASSTHP
jgi:hypothetical protein